MRAIFGCLSREVGAFGPCLGGVFRSPVGFMGAESSLLRCWACGGTVWGDLRFLCGGLRIEIVFRSWEAWFLDSLSLIGAHNNDIIVSIICSLTRRQTLGPRSRGDRRARGVV